MNKLRLSSGVTGLAVFLTVSTLLLAQPPAAAAQGVQGATLTVVTGETAVVRANGTASQPAASGTTLGVGDRVGTVGNSVALVTFFEGSEIELGADTTIILREIRSTGSEVHVTVEDVLGGTLSRIKAFANPNSTYQIQNPGGAVVALVRGSEIFFHVFPDGTVAVAIQCERQGEIRFGGRLLFECPGNRSFTISSRGEIVEGNETPEQLREEGVEPKDEEDGGDDSVDQDGKDRGDTVVGLRGPTAPSTGELLLGWLRQAIDSIGLAGAVLALGMLGWPTYRHRRGRH